jgi:hypothetical protein
MLPRLEESMAATPGRRSATEPGCASASRAAPNSRLLRAHRAGTLCAFRLYLMGRAKRAKLLLPSLVALASAACGGTSVTDQGGEPNVAGYPGNPPPLQWGGTGGEPGAYVAGAGLGGDVGGSINPPAPSCPESLPTNGSDCQQGLGGTSSYCEYTFGCIHASAACLTNSEWLVDQEQDGTCGDAGSSGSGPTNPPVPLSCPNGIPKAGSACYLPATVASYDCDYPGDCSPFVVTCTSRAVWSYGPDPVECAGEGGAP